jgi:hypothetical protein
MQAVTKSKSQGRMECIDSGEESLSDEDSFSSGGFSSGDEEARTDSSEKSREEIQKELRAKVFDKKLPLLEKSKPLPKKKHLNANVSLFLI